jgi:hypothetical protein
MFRSPNSSILGGALRRQIGELASALGINRPLPGRGNVDISGQYLVNGALLGTANINTSALGVNRPLPAAGNVDVSGQYLVGGSQIKTNNLSDVVNTITSWTPSDQSGAGLTLSATNCVYVRVGPIFFVFADFSYPTTADTHQALVGGLPFSTQVNAVNFDINGTVQWSGSGNLYWMMNGGTELSFANNLNFNQVANSALSGQRLRMAFAAV